MVSVVTIETSPETTPKDHEWQETEDGSTRDLKMTEGVSDQLYTFFIRYIS